MEPTLRRGALGTRDITFFVISAAAPLMIMAGVAPFAILAGGIGAPSAYLAAGVVLVVFAVGFTTMSRYVGNGGTLYAYVARALGRPSGITAAVVTLISYNAIQIGLYGLLGVTAHDTVQVAFGVDIPWPGYALAGVFIVWYAGFRSVAFGAKVLAVLLIAESGILLLVAIAVLVRGGAHGLTLDSFAPSNAFSGSTGSLLPFAFAAFIGFESAAVYRPEARDPDRTIPRATYISVGFLALFYGFVSWAVVQGYGSDAVVAAAQANPTELVFTISDRYVGRWATDLMHLLIVTGILASLVAFHNAINRSTMAAAQEGLLTSKLTAVHSRTGSPYAAGLVQTVLSLVVVIGFAAAGADPYRQLLIWVNTPGVLGIVALLAVVSVSVLVFFRRIPHTEGTGRTVVAPILAVIGLCGALYLMVTKITLLTNASPATNAVLIGTVPLMIVAGVLLALWLRRNRPAIYARLDEQIDTPAEEPVGSALP